VLGFLLGSFNMIVVSWLRAADAPPRGQALPRLQLLSAALYSLGHGGNDAQKTMGIIVMLLGAGGHTGHWAQADPNSLLNTCTSSARDTTSRGGSS
jgi:PiT family inorganic phosphate transporter